MSFDKYGHECAAIPIAVCPPIDLCKIDCDHVCALLGLLPYGAAWDAPLGYERDQSLCEPFNDCSPCEPVFVRNLVRLVSLQYAKTRQNIAWFIAQSNPLTAYDRAYWLRRWGLIDILYVAPPRPPPRDRECALADFECDEPCETAPIVCDTTPEQTAAIEYAMIRAHVLTSRPDFVPSMTNINKAMAYFGYSVSRSGIEEKYEDCFDGFTLASDSTRCNQFIQSLVLAPISDCLDQAPGDPCFIDTFCSDPVETDNLCLPIAPEKPCISAVCANPLAPRPAGVYAAAYLRRIWPVWQPYKITEVRN